MTETPTRRYRGSTLEELLPQIRRELGADAVITRRREGVVGGIGGFFGKRCVEVEARPARPVGRPVAALPPRAVVDCYERLPVEALPEEVGATGPERSDGTLMDELLSESSRFASELLQAVGQENRAAAGSDPEELRGALLAAGIPGSSVEEIVTEAERERNAFAPDEPLAAYAGRALARRLLIKRPPRRRRRRIVLVGPSGSGRTLTAAKLCHSYARAGASVCALSMEPVRRAVELAGLTEPFDIELAVADTPAAVTAVEDRLRAVDVVVTDSPPVEAGDRRRLDDLARLLAALRPSECQLVLPCGFPHERARLLLNELRARMRVDALVLTREDSELPPTPLGLVLSERLPVAYVARGAVAGVGVRPAQADELARLILT